MLLNFRSKTEHVPKMGTGISAVLDCFYGILATFFHVILSIHFC